MTGDQVSAFATAVADKYLVEAEIGSGGWGLIYRAHDLRNDRKVALKILRVEFTGSGSADRFRRETVILSTLHHPNIVEFYEAGEFAGSPWFAMSYVEGETLKDRLVREGQLPIGTALRIAKQVADALAHAHAHDNIHRDIKPANILLEGDRVFVADFGIARAISRGAREEWISSSGLQIGTPPYMSPEQAGGDEELDGRSDIYSLGCVLYEMLARTPPFAGPSPQAIMARHISDPVPPLETVRRSVPKSVSALVYRALAKSPADRFQTAAEFSQALEAVANDPTISVAGSGRRMRQAALYALGGALVVGGSALAWSASARAADARAVAAADTTRIAVFPFERGAGVAVELNTDQAMRRSLLRWSGVDVVDPFALKEAMGSSRTDAVSATKARAFALRLHAARYIRGTVTRAGDSLRLQAMMLDVSRGESPLFEATATTSTEAASLDGAFAGIADRLLFRRHDRAAAPTPTAERSSLAARQAYLSGGDALERWDLAAAESAFVGATRFDPHYAEASLWLALTRVWSERDTATWYYAAAAAAAGRDQLPPSDGAKLDALVALSRGERPRACATWDALTQREPFSFSAWYGAANCLLMDDLVLRDSASPSGWRFRSGRHSALMRYRRAFELRPAVLRALRPNAFAIARELFSTSGNDLRNGTSTGPNADYFAAFPSLEADTICFVPYSFTIIASSDPLALRRLPHSVSAAVLHQRRLFRDVAAGWAASEPRSADATHALALSLFLLGEPTAIDTLMRARSLALDPAEQQRVAATEVWMRVQFALPSDLLALRRARLLADSLLRSRPASPPDPQTLASIAALTGRASVALALDRLVSHQTYAIASTVVKDIARSLDLLAAFGGPKDTLLAMEARVDSLISVLVPAGQRRTARSEALGRAGVDAFPDLKLKSVATFGTSGLYLLDADAAFGRGDTAEVHRILRNLHGMREAFTLPELTLDALYPEAWLLAAMGDTAAAEQWLDPGLMKIRVSSTLVDPVRAAMLVRAMAFRAELAAQSGDRQTAAHWAAAVAELWTNADGFLQPTVRRMRELAR